MKKIFTLSLLLLGFSVSVFAQTSHIPGKVMVMLDPQENVDKFIQKLNADQPGANFHIEMEITTDWNIWLLGYENNFISDESALWLMNNIKGVTLAQFDYPVQTRVTTPNDASFGQQWSLNNTGQSGGTADADIDAPEAWDITTGGLTIDGDTIVVAVIDGGFQGNHPDLQSNFWINYDEIAGNGIDDDANGYIDDRNGWNAYNNNGTIPSDMHGTHVSGIIGAKGNNSTGVSGVNWNVKVMRVAGSSGTSATVVAAYAYVAKQRKLYNQTNGAQGAFVVSTNSSFGVDFGQAASYPIWCAFYDTLGTVGILSAGAGPNANTNIDTQGDIPTTCPSQYMIAVTNTNRNDAKNSSAGYGLINMDIGAPGTDVYNTVTSGNYSNLTGTSMATPHVAGAIGLYYSAACQDFIDDYKSNPSAGALQMRGFLLTGVDSISSMANTTSGKGRLNLYKGILKVQAGCNVSPPTAPTAGFTISDNNFCAGSQVTFTDTSANDPTSWSWTFTGATPSSSTQQNPTVTYNTGGTYNVSLTVTNAGGSNTQTLNSAITVTAIPSAPVATQNGNTFESSYNTGNQWYNSNGPVSGATNSTFTPQANGSYYVIHTDANGCVSAQSNTVLLTASVNEFELNSLSIYPNPFSTHISIVWQSAEAEVSQIRMYDAVGRLVYQSNKIEAGNVTISTSELPAGTYILEIVTNKGSMKKSIVK